MRPHPFGSPFDSLMVPSRVEALTAPSPAEGRNFGSGLGLVFGSMRTRGTEHPWIRNGTKSREVVRDGLSLKLCQTLWSVKQSAGKIPSPV